MNTATNHTENARNRLRHSAELANAMEAQRAFSWIDGTRRATVQAGVYLTHTQGTYAAHLARVATLPKYDSCGYRL